MHLFNMAVDYLCDVWWVTYVIYTNDNYAKNHWFEEENHLGDLANQIMK